MGDVAGVTYNPLSMASHLSRIITKCCYNLDDLAERNGYHHSWHHSSRFAGDAPDEVLRAINAPIEEAHSLLAEDPLLVATWGTAWVYELADSTIVNNCHKYPDSCFVRRRLTVDEIVDAWSMLVERLRVVRRVDGSPMLSVPIVMTVSPVRHMRDGMHENQLSKSTLLLAIDELQRRYPGAIYYFPAYELMMDELRDYRYYADDMLHPSSLAVRYIWESLAPTLFAPPALEAIRLAEGEARRAAHRPVVSTRQQR